MAGGEVPYNLRGAAMTFPRVPNKPVAGAKIFLVGENPWNEELERGFPFAGASGQELNRMLNEVGILRSECSVGNVIQGKPPTNDIAHFLDPRKRIAQLKGFTFHPEMKTYAYPGLVQDLDLLKRDLQETEPNVVVALGNTPLRALCGESGVSDWRGSILESKHIRRRDGRPFKVIPTYHPAYILRLWNFRHLVVQDFRRVAREAAFPQVEYPSYKFHIAPSFSQVMSWTGDLLCALARGPLRLAFDVETRARQITCLGIAKSHLEALCIPIWDFRKPDGCYWSEPEELLLVERICKLLRHPNLKAVGQNFNYDNQYTARNWGQVLFDVHDTMLAHHVNFCQLGKINKKELQSGTKGLAFLSSLYCDYHRYWKDEGKASIEEYWVYNCKDCVVTYEVSEVLEKVTADNGQEAQVEFQRRLQRPVLRMMMTGVRVDTTRRANLKRELTETEEQVTKEVTTICGHPLNPKSPKVQTLFYTDLRQPVVLHKKTKRPTADDQALAIIAKREPILKPLTDRISLLRSIGVFKSSFLEAPLDKGRLHTSYNQAGTITYRFSSSSDAFGFGTNLQNWSKGDSNKVVLLIHTAGAKTYSELEALVGPKWRDELDKGIESGHLRTDGTSVFLLSPPMPNLRKMLLPDPGHVIMDWDLERADLQVVVWEADDAEMKQLLRENLDFHTENAKIMFGKASGHVLDSERDLAKRWVHLTHYGGSPWTAARSCGITVHQAESMRKRYFLARPGIPRWHARIWHDLQTTKTVRNAFGFKMFFFDRIDELLPEALGWIPQSTVAIVINTGLLNLDEALYPTVQPLMQVHDSLVMQTRKEIAHAMVPKIKKCLEVVVPYPDPLVIPVSGKWSEVSLGDCKAIVEL